jgi:hypothetical protein
MRKMGPNCEALFHAVRNTYPDGYSHPPFKKYYEAARTLVFYGLIESVPNSKRTFVLTQKGRLQPVYIVKFKNKRDGDVQYQGPAGLCVNSGVITRHSTVLNKQDAYMYLSLISAQRAARHCNEQWRGKVEILPALFTETI